MQPQSILVFRQSSLGDVILTLPAIQRLTETFPQAAIDYLTKTAYAPVMETNPAIRQIYRFDDGSSFAAALRQLAHKKYDLFVDLQANFRSYIIQFSIFPGKTLRYQKRRWRREMAVRRPRAKISVEHSIIAYLRCLAALGISSELIPPRYTLAEDSQVIIREYLAKAGIPDNMNIIAICPGSRHPEKKWPLERFHDTVLRLLENKNTAIVVFTLSHDKIPPDLGIVHPRVLAACDFDIPRSAAMLARCRLALTNDSGLMHLANAVGTRAVAIFGPTNPRLGFWPSLPGSLAISDDVVCSPCSVHGQKKCYQPRKYCFERITPQRVLAELTRRL